ncbi:MAG: hypothetical protein ACREHC_04945 [Candidatus Levyibacteriota bacterium]
MAKSSKTKRGKKRRVSFVILGLLGGGLLLTIGMALQLQSLKIHADGVRFGTLPPGSALPTDAECAQKVRRSPWEPRPENQTANNDNVSTAGYKLTGSELAKEDPAYEARVTGNFTGTTDEIIQWGACKWGFDEDDVRAEAVDESQWKQSTMGDCNGTSQPDTNGCQSMGLLQIKGANIPPTHPGTYPYGRDSTAFNVDYTLAIRRACFEGKETWLKGNYAAGDEWGCIGRWYSGQWHDSGAEQYITRVKSALTDKTWNTYGGGEAPTEPTVTNAPDNPGTTTASSSGTTPIANVVPTFQCMGGIPCTSPNPNPSTSAVSQQPSLPVTNPSVPQPSISAAPSIIAQPLSGASTTQPCSASHSRNGHHDGGFLKEFGQFFLLLIQLLMQVIGGGTSAPCPFS